MKTITSTLATVALLLSSAISLADNSKLLKGAWLEQACHPAKGEVELSAQTSFKFESNQVLVINRYFESTDCSGEAIYVVDYEGALELGENQVLPNGEIATQYTITIGSVVPQTNTDGQALALTSVDNCEIRNWSFGETKDVFTCVFAKTQKNIIEDIAKVNGKTLFKGKLVTKA